MHVNRVLPTVVGSDWPQPLLSLFYHHSNCFYHHYQRVKSAKMLHLIQFNNILANLTTTQIILGRTLCQLFLKLTALCKAQATPNFGRILTYKAIIH